MGIKDVVRNMRHTWTGDSPPLALTEAAREAIANRVAEAEEPLAFFVATRPSALGFNVGVGFEPPDAESDRLERPEFGVPLRIAEDDLDRLRGYTIDFRDDRFVTFTDIQVHVSETPNPETRKFSVNRTLVHGGSLTFRRPLEDPPALIQLLFEVPQVKAAFLMNDFCSVTQEAGADWTDLQQEVGKRLQAYFAHGGAALDASAAAPAELGEVEAKVVELLEDVIRPAVQRDGGDIAFAGFEDGVVQLYMLGSCVGCPSSMATLKMGVENLLKDAIPEVREVMAIE